VPFRETLINLTLCQRLTFGFCPEIIDNYSTACADVKPSRRWDGVLEMVVFFGWRNGD
jgi:hypothetical protein